MLYSPLPMTLHHKIAYNTIFQLLGKGISTVLGLVATMLLLRTLGAERYGWYTTANGFLQFVGILGDFGFTLTVSNLIAAATFSKEKILNTSLTLRLITACALYGVATLIFFFLPYPSIIKITFALIALSYFSATLNQVFIGYYQATLHTSIITIGEIIGRIILVLGIALSAQFSTAFLLMMATITAASLVYTFYFFIKTPGLKLAYDRAIVKTFWQRTWPTALAIIFNAVYLQGDRVILPFFVSQTVVGYYGAAYRVLDVVIQSAAIIMGIMMPLLTAAWAQGNKTDFKKYYHLSLTALALLLFPTIAGIAALHNPIMHFVAGKNFVSTGNVSPGTILQFLSITIFGICFGMTFGHIGLAINRQKEGMYIFASNAVLSLIGYGLFIPRYGVWGAIGVTIFSDFYAGIGLMLVAIVYSQTKPNLLPLLKIALASVGMAALLSLLPSLPLLASIFLGCASYATAILLLKVIPLSHLQSVGSFFHFLNKKG